MPEAKTILIIEDEPLVRFSLKAYLEDSGFACLEAPDGASGVALFERANPDLVLTDLWMPSLDGFGVIRAIRERSPSMPVVLLTGTGDEESAREAAARGAAACLFKPILNMRRMVETLQAVLDAAEAQGGGR